MRGVDSRLVLHRMQELRFGLFHGQTGDLFESRALLRYRTLKLLFVLGEAAVAFLDLGFQRHHGLIAFGEFGRPIFEFLFLFSEPAGKT